MYYLFVIILLTTSCSSYRDRDSFNSRKSLIKSDSFNVKAVKFTEKSFIEDKTVMLNFFKHGYSGYHFIDKELIKKAETELESITLENTNSWSSFCSKVTEAFSKLPDGHLNAYSKEGLCSFPKRTKKIRSRIGDNIFIKSQKKDKAYRVTYTSKNNIKYGVIGIKRFPSFNSKKWDGFEETLKGLKTNSDAIIVDLRGNSGGDDTRGIQLASLLKGKEINKKDYAQDFELTHPASYVLLLNKITSKELDAGKEAWAYHRNLIEGFLSSLQSNKYRSSFGENPLRFSNKVKPYKKPIYVLADRQCGSSGESTLHALRALSNITFIGQNTAGVTHFGNQGLLILPNSRIRLSMSTKFIKFRDGTFVEKVGHKPDVYIPNGQDALAQTMIFDLKTRFNGNDLILPNKDFEVFKSFQSKRKKDYDRDIKGLGEIELIKKRLKYMVDVDQKMRSLLSLPSKNGYDEKQKKYFMDRYLKLSKKIDGENTNQLKKLLKKYNWFTISKFGKESDRNAWLLIQHADHDSDFQKMILERLSQLLPTGETNKSNYAYLYDRVAASWNNVKKRTLQKYGTQGECSGREKWKPLPMVEPDNLDRRRNEVDLGPMSEYLERVKKYCY